MGRTILVTGASGAIGPHVLAELLRWEGNERIVALVRPGSGCTRRVDDLVTAVRELGGGRSPHDRLQVIAGDIGRDDLGLERRDRDRLSRQVHVVVHAAANTRFAAYLSDLQDANVKGTGRVLDLARRCPRLRQFLLVSTACVAGTTTGLICERLDSQPRAFVNPYEQTKWEAERLVAASGLPVRIARLSTCLGGERTGYVHRFGAIHQSIRWLTRGLVSMVPAASGARVDLIASDVAARWIARAATRPVDGLDVCHVAAGDRAIRLPELLDATVAHLRASIDGWATGEIEPPAIVDGATFELFARSVAQSGNPLFARALDSAMSFFPGLLYPKVYDTSCAELVWGGPLPLSDWRSTLTRVIDFGRACDWHRPRPSQAGACV